MLAAPTLPAGTALFNFDIAFAPFVIALIKAKLSMVRKVENTIIIIV
jgi:hypothetical protein